jgi:hypothetical protein
MSRPSEARLTISFSKRLAKLEEPVASRTQGPKTIRRVVVEAGADLPTEGPDALLVCRVIVTPPERPADEPLPTTQAVSPRIEHGDRTPIEVQRPFDKRIRYPHFGTA